MIVEPEHFELSRTLLFLNYYIHVTLTTTYHHYYSRHVFSADVFHDDSRRSC